MSESEYVAPFIPQVAGFEKVGDTSMVVNPTTREIGQLMRYDPFIVVQWDVDPQTGQVMDGNLRMAFAVNLELLNVARHALGMDPIPIPQEA
ncbi:MAG: hypothetical protein PHS44_04660 [Candidatus Dojkabacteria bacterium]|nr:hypothetical protein [Candidatus Dojkabacteria bacterium]